MKTKLKIFFGIAFLLFIVSPTVNSQILQTPSEVIESYGTPFSSGITHNGEEFLFYKIPVKTKSSGTYHQRRVLFFKDFGDGAKTCYKFKIIEPSSETKANVSSFTRNLVQIDDMQWKDYGKGIVYTVEEVNGICFITAFYDNEVELARIYKM